MLLSRTNSLTQTHALFLEWLCIQEAKKIGRYSTGNGNDGTKPHTPAPLEADCYEIFDTGRTLLATLGYPIFESIVKLNSSAQQAELFYCKRAGTNAIGEYTEEGFVVLKGSLGKANLSPAFVGHAFAKNRDELIEAGKVVIKGDVLEFIEDVLFSSPSGASATVCGNASNGWLEWKNDKGITLDELKRGNSSVPANE